MAVPGPFFFEAPTETVGRRPCSHGGGPLRELDGQCPPSPIAGSPVPCSAPSGALRRNTKGMRAPIGPLPSGFPPPPLAPAKGGRWLRTASAPGLRLPPAASPADSAGSRLCPLGSGYRRLCPPVAPPPSRPPARLATPCGRLGRLRHSVLRLALGLLRVGLRPALRATAGSPPALLRRNLGGSPQDGPCSSWLVARSPRSATSAGLWAPLLPPGAWSGPAGRFLRPPAPGVFGRSSQGDKVGLRSWQSSGAFSGGSPPGIVIQLCPIHPARRMEKYTLELKTAKKFRI